MKTIARWIPVLLLLSILPALAEDGGTSPSTARRLVIGEEISGTVRTSLYFDVVAEQDGFLDVEVTPTNGEVDLAAVHFSGSPAAESRREGAVPDKVTLRLSRGDRYLVRVISPFAKPAQFRLKTSWDRAQAPASSSPPAAPGTLFVPQRPSNGRSAAEAVVLPVGRLVAVEARGTRYFRTVLPVGFVLDISLCPVYGSADLEVVVVNDATVSRSLSARPGQLTERVYLPGGKGGEVLIKVSSPVSPQSDDLLRYGLVARTREPGIGTMVHRPEPEDHQAVATVFAGRLVGHGVPGWGEGAGRPGVDDESRSKILHLP